MNLAGLDRTLKELRSAEGKGMAGCLFFLLLLAIAVFVGIIVGPTYYSHYSFETDVKAVVARAGAHFFDDDTLAKEILDLAKRDEIRLARENVKVERFAGQLWVTINYSVPVDFMVFQRTLDFEIKSSSYIGRL